MCNSDVNEQPFNHSSPARGRSAVGARYLSKISAFDSVM